MIIYFSFRNYTIKCICMQFCLNGNIYSFNHAVFVLEVPKTSYAHMQWERRTRTQNIWITHKSYKEYPKIWRNHWTRECTARNSQKEDKKKTLRYFVLVTDIEESRIASSNYICYTFKFKDGLVWLYSNYILFATAIRDNQVSQRAIKFCAFLLELLATSFCKLLISIFLLHFVSMLMIDRWWWNWKCAALL